MHDLLMLLKVPHLNMSSEVIFPGRSLGTEWTKEGFLAGVSENMARQVARDTE